MPVMKIRRRFVLGWVFLFAVALSSLIGTGRSFAAAENALGSAQNGFHLASNNLLADNPTPAPGTGSSNTNTPANNNANNATNNNNNGGSSNTNANGSNNNNSQDDPQLTACEDNSGGLLGPALCAVIQGVDSMVNWLYTAAIDHLQFSLFKPATTTDPNSGESIGGLNQDAYKNVKGSWQVVARLSTTLLVVVFLVMIIAQATSNLLEPYTVKRLLWRIVVAFILINISWYLVTAVLEIANIIGGGIRDILLSPISGQDAAAIVTPGRNGGNVLLDAVLLHGVASAATVGVLAIFAVKSGGLVGMIKFAFYLIMPIFITMAITLIIGFAVIILRQGLLILLAITAPFAVLLWVSEGTRKYYDKWKDLFVTLLLFFPAFQAVIAIGALVAYAVSATGSKGGATAFTFLVAIVCYFAPFFMVFKILEFLGGVPHAAASFLRGNAATQGLKQKYGGYFQGKRERSAFGLRRAELKKEREHREIENSAEYLGRPGSTLGRSGLTRGGARDVAKFQRKLRNFSMQQQQEALSDYSVDFTQAWAKHGGNVQAALQELQDRGVIGAAPNDAMRQAALGTYTALEQQGIHATDSSVQRAVGNIAAQQGNLWRAYDDGQGTTHEGYGQFYQNSAGAAGTPENAEAGSIAQAWNIQARSAGQAELNRLKSLGDSGVSNLPNELRSMRQAITAAAQTARGTGAAPSPLQQRQVEYYDQGGNRQTYQLPDFGPTVNHYMGLLADAERKGVAGLGEDRMRHVAAARAQLRQELNQIDASGGYARDFDSAIHEMSIRNLH